MKIDHHDQWITWKQTFSVKCDSTEMDADRQTKVLIFYFEYRYRYRYAGLRVYELREDFL